MCSSDLRLFVRRLSETYGRAVSLATIPEEEWEALKDRGFDLVWLMGVWRRSPAARPMVKQPIPGEYRKGDQYNTESEATGWDIDMT